ncbi:MAG TPA: DUF488 domain-containing protein [Ktedonobacterales bacterium]|nr:DUF488 domain-containing protein [Ktedonobacterales bacterium]
MSKMSEGRVKLKRVYEAPEPEDGQRVLIDRLWPRGLKREDARLDAWLRDIAPSDGLRRWFGHDPARWDEFQARYRRELEDSAHQAELEKLRDLAQRDPVTLLFAAKDTEHCNAQVVRALLEAEPEATD